jgi:glycosyltransferase involved in cell wall biosynthesis
MSKIVFVAPFGLGQKTTVWARTLPLARQLAAHGHTVTLIVPPWDTPADAGRQWVTGGVRVINVELAGGTLVVVARMLRALYAAQPEIVHIVKPRAHAGLVHWWLWQGRRFRRIKRLKIKDWKPPTIFNLQSSFCQPQIFLDVDDWEQAWAEINHYSPLLARFLAWQEEWGLRHADGISAASQWLVAKAQQSAPATPVLYLPNGVDLPTESVGNVPHLRPLGPPSLLFFTRFIEVQPSWLAACWQAIHAQLPAARLLVAGSPVQPGLAAPYRLAVAQLSPAAAKQVEWLGFVPPAQLTALYAQVTLALCPAEDVPLQQAKCSVRLATTLLNGVPVVASAVGEQANYGAAGAARLVPAGAAAEQFAQAVIDLLQHPAEQAQMVAQAQQQLAARYRWQELGKGLADFYKFS